MENHVFSGRAEDYVKFRTDYPEYLRTYLLKELGISKTQTIADIGSGTGLLSKWLLELGARVYGVEPNDDMRKEGEKNLVGFRNFISIKGSAEATTLMNHSVDFVAAGNAFHWFDPEKSKVEFRRILRAHGQVFLVRTDWKEFPAERMKGYDDLIMKYCAGRGGVVTNPDLERKMMDQFFSTYTRTSLGESEHLYTREQLRGRFLSTSFSPTPSDARHGAAMKELDALFDKFQVDGTFSFGVITTVICGTI